MLSNSQMEQFLYEGFVHIENAFPTSTASVIRDILWKETGCDPSDPATWTKPVIRLGMFDQKPFVDAANTGVLLDAFDQLVGPGAWLPCRSMGTFPIRFPSSEDPGDTGWHVDASFPGNDPGNYLEWRINIASKGRALLMLFLFSDVGEQDAPTRIRSGSHLDVARLLKHAGEWGLSAIELAGKLAVMPERQEVQAIGKAGTVYLCHPFLVHAAQPHKGKEPKFMAQPPLLLKDKLMVGSPVELAIQLAINK